MKNEHDGAQRARESNAESRIARILREWSPISVQGGGEAPVDESADYAPLLVELAASGASAGELAQHLALLRSAMPGAAGDEPNDKRIAEAIVAALAAPDASESDTEPSAQRSDHDEGSYICPHCSEQVVVPLDRSEGEAQRYVEDCPVCCNPIVIQVEFVDGDEPPRVSAQAE